MKIDIHKISQFTGEPDFDIIEVMFSFSRGSLDELIISRFHGAAIATGRRVAKALRLLGVHPSTRVVDTSLIDEKNLDNSATCHLPWKNKRSNV